MNRPWVPVCMAAVIAAGCSTSVTTVQWEYTGGPEAQNINVVAVDLQNPGRLYAGLATGDVGYTSDGGHSWQALARVDSSPLLGLVVDPEDSSTITATTGNGLFRSRDHGRSWVATPDRRLRSSCRGYTIDPWNTNIHYVGVSGAGLFRSIDRGQTWSRIDSAAIPPGSDVYDIEMDRTQIGVGIAAVYGTGLIRSTDGGLHWKPMGDDLGARGTYVTHVAMHSRIHGLVVIGTSTGNIFRSSDEGRSWSPTRQGRPPAVILSLEEDPYNDDVLYAGTDEGVLLSSDFGTSWKPVSSALPTVPTGAAVANSDGGSRVYLFGEGVGLQTWSPFDPVPRRVDTGLGGSDVAILRSSRNGSMVYCALARTVHTFRDSSATWECTSKGLSGYGINTIAVAPESSLFLFAGTDDGIFKTVDGAASWSPVTRTLRSIPVLVLEPHPVIRHRIYAGGKQGLYISTNNGAGWVQAKPFNESYNMHSLTFSGRNAGILYAPAEGHGIVRSTDGGFSWNTIPTGLPADGIACITTVPENDNTVFAWTNQGACYTSTDGGLGWTSYTPPWPAGSEVRIASDRYHPSDVVAVVNSRDVYFSPTGGTTWLPVACDVLGEPIHTLHYNGVSHTVYAGTKNLGVFRLRIGQMLEQMFND